MTNTVEYGRARYGILTDFAYSFFLWVFLCSLIFFFSVEDLKTRSLSDEIAFHWPTILHFVNGGSVSDYPSATTPGYHLFVFFWIELMGANKESARLFSAIFTGFLCFSILRIWRGAVAAPLYYSLPAILCIYTLPGGVWMTPDNLAWFANFGVIMLSLSAISKGEVSWLWCVVVGGAGALTVFFRQSSIWVLVVPFFALYSSSDRLVLAVCKALLVLAPPVAVLVYFLFIWGGFTPPTFQQRHTGLNLASWPYFFACFFAANIWLAFFLPIAAGAHAKRMLAGFSFGVLLGVFFIGFVDLSYQPEFRAGGLWELGKYSRKFIGESVLIASMSVLGSGLFFATLSMTRRTTVCAVLLVFIAFIVCMAANKYTYDRYYVLAAIVVVPVIFSKWIDVRAFGILNDRIAKVSYLPSYFYAIAGYATFIKG